MSIEAMTWAFKQPLSSHEKVILLAIADHANDDGECWPSIAKVAQKACVSERTAQRYIIKLTDEGYLSTVSRSADNGGRMANKYVLHMATNVGGEGDSLTPPGDTSVTTPGDTVVTPNEPSVITIKKNNNRACRVPDDFRPNATSYRVGAEVGLSRAQVDAQVDPFLDYWRAVPGAKGLSPDWNARFRTWLRNHVKFNAGRNANGTRNTPKPNSIDDIFGKLHAVNDEIERREQESSHGHG